MHEHVVAVGTADEAIALVIVEELHGPDSQNDLFS
jgi:hypothetical protein